MSILTRYIPCIPKLWRQTSQRWLSDKAPVLFECGPDLEDRGISTVDACDALKSLPQPRVVVVGAGMAGLAAASRLAERGITDVTVLEAYERPGGRIFSCWLGDVIVELGAHWRPTNKETHPIYKFSAKESPPRPGVPGIDHHKGLYNAVVSGKMEFPPTLTAYNKFRQIEKEAAQIYCLGGNKQHGSLINFMSLRIQQELHEFPEEQQHDAARILFGLVQGLSARGSRDRQLLSADHSGCFMNMPGGTVRVPLGLSGILSPLLRKIPEGAIRYCKPVNVIYWGTSQKKGCRATVCTLDGDEYPADYVIITVSLGVLCASCSRLFCPTLPASKVDAMRCLRYGHCNKIYLEYCRPFWFWFKGDIKLKFPGDTLNWCTNWARGIRSIEIVPHSKHVLCVWVLGQEAAMMEWLCDKDIADGVTSVLRWATKNQDIPHPETVMRSNWSLDPFFHGAYSYDPNCEQGLTQRALSCPLPGPSEPIPPILLFAGEATVPGHFATVAGARLSGIREAERIVHLTRQYKGPPATFEVGKYKKCGAFN